MTDTFWADDANAFVIDPASVATSAADTRLVQHAAPLSNALNDILLTDEDRAMLLRLQQKLYVCAWCMTPYYEIQNIGQWTCTAHVSLHNGFEWTCCHKSSLDALGCVQCHHYPKKDSVTRREFIYLTRALFENLKERLSSESQLTLNATELARGYSNIISRYDVIDVKIVKASGQDAREQRRLAELRLRGFDGDISSLAAPQTRSALAEQMELAGVPRRFWIKAMR